MTYISRRALSRYAVDELLAGRSPRRLAKQLAAVLLATKRASDAEPLITDIAAELENRGAVAVATVISAHQLTPNLRRQISSNVKKAAKVDRVTLNEVVDPEVLAGVRIETAKHAWDKTARKLLTDIKRSV
ncbi:MAG: F0F1 ATP synthase subunit delta [Candidatus Saccharimonadales bacterium]